ncbi:MAG: hypothetical protein IT270_13435, partial [Saprospiraceae bacterium]|nr:hypothetical protein [Saprospiraceae bacterium]
MTFLGNTLLIIAAFLYVMLLNAMYTRVPRGGDAVMGYAWGIIILNGALSVVLILAAVIAGTKNGFDWVSPNGANRFLITSGVLLGALVLTALSALFKNEGGPVPVVLRLYGAFAPVLFPFILIAVGFILINPELRATLHPAVYRGPLVVLTTLTAVGIGGSLMGWMQLSQIRASEAVEYNKQREDKIHQSHLDDIDNCDVSKNMVFILVFTDANHDQDVREKALAKIKSRTDWQQEMLRLLGCDWAPQAFTFLASNDVDDKQLFAEPVREGVLIQARLIRESIRKSYHESHFYPDLFFWEVERVLRSVDRFQETGVDYKPAV